MRMINSSQLAWSSIVVVLGLVWLSYLPGLHGDFLFDDFANMPALGASGPVTHWSTFFRYITSGTADPTGRPLTLLTFLLDGHDWPTAAYPFKRTNVLLHLINGILLALLLVQLGKRLYASTDQGTEIRTILAAITASSLWLIHPLFVSTVLYVVQREAMLPMTFVLIGLMLWLRGRDLLLLQARTLPGVTLMLMGLGGCTLLAVLCKANGALLPAYALLIEYLVLSRIANNNAAVHIIASPARGTAIYQWLFRLLAWLPTLMLLTYLIYVGVKGALHGVGRPWTLGQRLLTEPRVLFDYLDLLWAPRPFTPGLFNDQFAASHSLLSPSSTALALLGVIGLLALGWKLRRQHPALSLTILFYFVGQLLESTTVPLELYFEHRNYIPAMLMFWPLSLWLWDAGKLKPGIYLRAKVALAIGLLLGLGLMTHARAELWGNGQEQALLWAKLNPASARAQANAANYEMSNGQPAAAEKRLLAILSKHPDDPQITLNILSAHCQMGGISQSDIQLAERTLSHLSKGQMVIYHWLGNAIELSAKHGCHGLGSDAIEGMLDAAASNPRLHRVIGRMQDIDHLRGQLALSLGKPDQALDWFQKGLALRPSPQMAFEQAAALGSAGYPAVGLKELDFYETKKGTPTLAAFGMPRIHAWVLRKQNYWGKELVYLRGTLQSDIKQSRQAKASKNA